MKTTLSACAVAVAALLAAAASAGDEPSADGPHNMMRADKDGDGRISRAEAAAAGSERSAAWFDKLDTNKDGYLTPDELKQARDAHHDHMHGDMKARMEERFKEADTNNDGQLSLAEIQAKMPRLAERFTALDTNKDGQLSKEELRRGGPHHGPKPEGEPQN